MEIIIKIPSEMYDWFDNGFPDEDDVEKLWQIIKNGTLLPKGHGRLIDESQIPGDSAWDFSDRLMSTPTIVKADEE